MYHSQREDEREVNRFNACNFLGEFLMRNNPKYGKNKETHDKFLRYTRKERKLRMIKTSVDIMNKKVSNFYLQEKMHLNKTNIVQFVNKVDKQLKLKNTLATFDWIEHFRVYKDEEEISLDNFLKAFEKAILEIHEIDEEMVKILLK